MVTRPRKKPGPRLEAFLERSRLIGSIVAGVSVVLLIVGAAADGFGADLASAFGGSLLTAALVSILYEAFQKRSLLGDVFSALRVRDSVSEMGLRDIRRGRECKVDELVAGAEEITVLPLDPIRWLQEEFGHLLEAAGRRPVQLRVLLPAADEPYLQLLAERLNTSVTELERRLNDLSLHELGDAWEARGGMDPRSALEVSRFTGAPGYGLLVTNELIALEVGPALAFGAVDRTTYVFVLARPSANAETWIESQLENLDLSRADVRPRPESGTEVSADTAGTSKSPTDEEA